MNEIVDQKGNQFLSDLLNEIELADHSTFEPHGAVDKGETVLGQMTEWQRKVFSLCTYYKRELKRMKVDAEFEGDIPREQMELIGQAQHKYDALHELLYGALRQHFRCWGSPNVGLRDNCQVIISDASNDPREKFRGFIAGMFGIDPNQVE